MPAGARERRDRLVSSEYWWIWAVRPCLAAMVKGRLGLYVLLMKYLQCRCYDTLDSRRAAFPSQTIFTYMNTL